MRAPQSQMEKRPVDEQVEDLREKMRLLRKYLPCGPRL
jgi:hypothetical protein